MCQRREASSSSRDGEQQNAIREPHPRRIDLMESRREQRHSSRQWSAAPTDDRDGDFHPAVRSGPALDFPRRRVDVDPDTSCRETYTPSTTRAAARVCRLMPSVSAFDRVHPLRVSADTSISRRCRLAASMRCLLRA